MYYFNSGMTSPMFLELEDPVGQDGNQKDYNFLKTNQTINQSTAKLKGNNY